MSIEKNDRKIRVVDLFSGVGGLTFGFYYKILNQSFVKNVDFEIVFANDFSEPAAKAFELNYPDIKMLNVSIEDIDSAFLDSQRIDYSNIDVIIGGPPCQSYSTIGKRKDDDRAKLYVEYMRLLDLIKPKMFIFENVLGILSFKDENGNKVIDIISKKFSELGYNISIQTLNAKDYGVPENRVRVFLVGVKNDRNITWMFPKPFDTNPITLQQAIGDLPKLKPNKPALRYKCSPMNDFQVLLRNGSKEISEHFYCGYGRRITRIISSLGYGQSHDDINKKVENGELPASLFLTSGYNNSYGRLVWEKPCATITNNFGTPSSNRCIHPVENRALTIREAARVQSFPDFFAYFGNLTEKRKQIGNAVPPLLSIELAKCVFKALRGNYDGK